MPSKENYAYLAGLIDGEGYVTSGKTEGTRINGKKWNHCYVRLGIKMTSEIVLRWVYNTFGGRFYERNPDHGGFGGKKLQYVWEMTRGDDLKYIIEKIRPYMKIKGQHLDLILEYLNNFIDLRYINLQSVKQKEETRRCTIREKLTLLNKGESIASKIG